MPSTMKSVSDLGPDHVHMWIETEIPTFADIFFGTDAVNVKNLL